jgi:indolepyruvate ferredoxin oxidoreductase
VDLASVPEHIRGYGHVRRAHLTTAKTRESVLLAQFRSPQSAPAPIVIKMAV